MLGNTILPLIRVASMKALQFYNLEADDVEVRFFGSLVYGFQ